MSSAAPALVSAAFPGVQERRRAFGRYVVVAGVAGPALGLAVAWSLPLVPGWRAVLFAGVPFAVAAAVAVAVLAYDRPGRAGLRFDGWGVLLGAAGVVGVSGAVPHFTGHVVLLPAAVLLLAAYLWRQARTAGALGSPPGERVQVPGGAVVATAVVNVGVVVLLMATGHLPY
ncbi:hypothetical protein [Streptomyces sp. NPDC057854]|uniref:hypothetical protein n=1 Tax=unclassified Streptomyces TaxID=2593676 RepID=UPI003688B72A